MCSERRSGSGRRAIEKAVGTMTTRQEIFAQSAKKLRADFDELTSIPHNALKGYEAEGVIRDFLNGHLPKRFAAGSGFIIDQRDTVSRQTDVVIYDAFNCPVYRASDAAAIFPSNNVAAVVEVKSRLNKRELRDAWDKIESAKKLAKVRSHRTTGYVRDQTLGCVFAFDSSVSLPTIGNYYADLLRERGIGHHVDLIAVLDKGIIMLGAQLPGQAWNACFIDEMMTGPAAEGSHFGVSVHEVGRDTLDGFLRLLLPNLMAFRSHMDHPGLAWERTESGGLGMLHYLFSYTAEIDPILRATRLSEYSDQVEAEFAANPVPPNYRRKSR